MFAEIDSHVGMPQAFRNLERRRRERSIAVWLQKMTVPWLIMPDGYAETTRDRCGPGETGLRRIALEDIS